MAADLICLSHLRWNFVFQRPQHVLTRLAKHYRVYFFEEPVASASKEHLDIIDAAQNVRVCRAHSTIGSPGFSDDQIPTLQQMLSELVKRERIEDFFTMEQTLTANERVGKAMADYHELVESGRREIYRIEH